MCSFVDYNGGHFMVAVAVVIVVIVAVIAVKN